MTAVADQPMKTQAPVTRNLPMISRLPALRHPLTRIRGADGWSGAVPCAYCGLYTTTTGDAS
jgi:hypothetical protein